MDETAVRTVVISTITQVCGCQAQMVKDEMEIPTEARDDLEAQLLEKLGLTVNLTELKITTVGRLVKVCLAQTPSPAGTKIIFDNILQEQQACIKKYGSFVTRLDQWSSIPIGHPVTVVCDGENIKMIVVAIQEIPSDLPAHAPEREDFYILVMASQITMTPGN